jgi:hypothetical protein
MRCTSVVDPDGHSAAAPKPRWPTSCRSSPTTSGCGLQRDHALATQGKFGEVVTMWNEFIGRHATDPRPYAERAGAKWHVGNRDDARADMKKACESRSVFLSCVFRISGVARP